MKMAIMSLKANEGTIELLSDRTVRVTNANGELAKLSSVMSAQDVAEQLGVAGTPVTTITGELNLPIAGVLDLNHILIGQIEVVEDNQKYLNVRWKDNSETLVRFAPATTDLIINGYSGSAGVRNKSAFTSPWDTERRSGIVVKSRVEAFSEGVPNSTELDGLTAIKLTRIIDEIIGSVNLECKRAQDLRAKLIFDLCVFNGYPSNYTVTALDPDVAQAEYIRISTWSNDIESGYKFTIVPGNFMHEVEFTVSVAEQEAMTVPVEQFNYLVDVNKALCETINWSFRTLENGNGSVVVIFKDTDETISESLLDLGLYDTAAAKAVTDTIAVVVDKPLSKKQQISNLKTKMLFDLCTFANYPATYNRVDEADSGTTRAREFRLFVKSNANGCAYIFEVLNDNVTHTVNFSIPKVDVESMGKVIAQFNRIVNMNPETVDDLSWHFRAGTIVTGGVTLDGEKTEVIYHCGDDKADTAVVLGYAGSSTTTIA